MRPNFSFTVDNFSVEESNGSLYPILIHFDVPPAVDMMLYVTTQGVTAMPGSDYEGMTNLPILVPAGTRVFQVPLTIIDDDIVEPTETLRVIVRSSPTALEGSVATVTIIDDDGGPVCTDNEFDRVLLSDPRLTSQDGNAITVDCNSVLLIDASSQPIVSSNQHYDFAYGEGLVGGNPPRISLDWLVIQVAESESGPWHTVFYWGDDQPDHNTVYVATQPYSSIYSYKSMAQIMAARGGIEEDDLTLEPGLIYINIDERAPSGTYSYLRVLSPKSGLIDPADVDMIYRMDSNSQQPPIPVGALNSQPMLSAWRRYDQLFWLASRFAS
jgi:hypothetical protein